MPFSLDDVTAALALLGRHAFENLQLIDAGTLAAQYYPHHDPNAPALVLGVDGVATSERVRDVLVQVYGGQHGIVLLGGEREDSTLAELAEHAAIRAFFLPELTRPASYAALQDVIARLRAPGGCPWDRALTLDTLRPFLLEEAYELLAALDAGDFARVSEEQGDLLLQVALQAQIATEEGRFRFPDVTAHIVEKLIRRHPHVFGEVQVSGADEVLANWEAIKAQERAQNGDKKSPLAGIPPGLPALAQAEAYLDRMSRLGPHDTPPQPWGELASMPDDQPLEPDVLGDCLFGIVAWAMGKNVDAESALRSANARYAKRVAEEGWG